MNPHLENLSPEELTIAQNAIRHVKEHRREIIERFAGTQCPSTSYPISMFMAGSPGAGKTEVSKYLLKELQSKCIRLDPDDLRSCFTDYTGSNSKLFQSAVSIAIEKLHDHVIDKSKSFILDGTFWQYGVAKKNVERSINKGRIVVIVYVYQDPVIAWRFTKQRELKEGRNIPKESFIEQFIGARETVQKIKDEFGDKVRVWLIQRNLESDQNMDFNFNILNIDSFIKTEYSRETLKQLIG